MMGKRSVECIIKQQDCLMGKQQILHQGDAVVEGQVFSFYDENGKQTIISFYPEGAQITRKAETETKIDLVEGKSALAEVVSEYGTITLQTKLIYCQKKEESWEIEYQLLDQHDVILHTHLFCQWV